MGLFFIRLFNVIGLEGRNRILHSYDMAIIYIGSYEYHLLSLDGSRVYFNTISLGRCFIPQVNPTLEVREVLT